MNALPMQSMRSIGISPSAASASMPDHDQNKPLDPRKCRRVCFKFDAGHRDMNPKESKGDK